MKPGVNFTMYLYMVIPQQWDVGTDSTAPKPFPLTTSVLFTLQTKCERYWPDPTFRMQEKYGDIVVTFDSAIGRDGYQITSLYISHSQSLEAPRRVYHYWYTAWPDHGVPDSPRQFLRLVEEVHIAQDREDVKEGPVVVHCRLVTFWLTSYWQYQLSVESFLEYFISQRLFLYCISFEGKYPFSAPLEYP